MRGAAFIDSVENLMLVEGPTMQLMDLDKERCGVSGGSTLTIRRAASADGRLIAIADFQKVNIWTMTDLRESCVEKP